jgi:pimeloyl-ACP methyl ester carboxylesterase
MYYSVWCYEDLPHLSEEGELGMYYFDPDVGLSRAVCDLLPQPGEETPAAGLTPTVLAEVTPTPGGEEIVADASATPADADAGTPTEEGAATPTVGIDVERSFPRTDIPVLLISGDADPVTPPANGEQVAEIFTNNLHVVLPGMAHSNFYVGCMPTVVRDFIESAGVADLDTGCTQTIRPLPFFLSPVGPKP